MTMDPDALEVAQIDQQIAALEHRKAQLRGQVRQEETPMERGTAMYYLQYVEDIDALGHDVTAWEAEFLESMLSTRPAHLSANQQETIRRMARKYLGEEIG